MSAVTKRLIQHVLSLIITLIPTPALAAPKIFFANNYGFLFRMFDSEQACANLDTEIAKTIR